MLGEQQGSKCGRSGMSKEGAVGAEVRETQGGDQGCMALKATGPPPSELGVTGGFEQKNCLTCILTLSLWLLC